MNRYQEYITYQQAFAKALEAKNVSFTDDVAAWLFESWAGLETPEQLAEMYLASNRRNLVTSDTKLTYLAQELARMVERQEQRLVGVAGFLQGLVSVELAQQCVEQAEQAVEASHMLRIFKRVLTLTNEASGATAAARIAYIEDLTVKNLTSGAGELLHQSTSTISNLARNAEVQALAEAVSTIRAIQAM